MDNSDENIPLTKPKRKPKKEIINDDPPTDNVNVTEINETIETPIKEKKKRPPKNTKTIRSI
jgi:hypothetical protein